MKYMLLILNIVFSQLYLELIATDFDKPIYVTSHPKNSNIIYVVEQEGYIWSFEYATKIEKVFLDLSDRIHKPVFPGDERGLLGFAFDPNYHVNGFIYINYNDKEGNTVISRLTCLNDNNNGLKYPDVNTEIIMMKFKQPYSNHNGGHLAFGPDGFLYISVGDGGSAGDPENRAQDLTNVFGTILRIQPIDDGSYNVPYSNPFINNDMFKNEIWTYGLRNVWRFSFDRLSGDMYLGDVGQNSWEEINYIKYGNNDGINFGWNIMEASSCFKDDCTDSLYTYPVFEYPNDAKYIRTLFGLKHKNVHGCSVTGGYVYRGKDIPSIYGKYIFGDYCTGKIWSFSLDNYEIHDFVDHTSELLSSINKKKFYLSSFGETLDGEILLVDYNGSIYKLKIRN